MDTFGNRDETWIPSRLVPAGQRATGRVGFRTLGNGATSSRYKPSHENVPIGCSHDFRKRTIVERSRERAETSARRRTRAPADGTSGRDSRSLIAAEFFPGARKALRT
nr:MAG: hypothetical protein DIU78_26185 [Pseudomonadota bacterium]